MRSSPDSIDHGAGERIAFHGVRRNGRGEFLDVHDSVAPGAGPPMLVHRLP